MAPGKIRLLVAEDSAYMQMAIRTMVKVDPAIEIVAEARDGAQAVELAQLLRPDIVTMDVNMPGLNGIEAARRIMAEAPTAIIMLSSITDKGVAATQQALEAGALDYVSKAGSAADMDLASIALQLAGRIRFWGLGARAFVGRDLGSPRLPADADLLVVAGGAGSTVAMGSLLRRLEVGNCAVLVSHDAMPAEMTPSLIDYLARVTGRPIREGGHRVPVARGGIVVMPGGRHAGLRRDPAGNLMLDFRNAGKENDRAALARVALEAAKRPVLALMSGEARQLAGLVPELMSRGTALWIQDPAQCPVPALALEAAAFGLPYATLALAIPATPETTA
jgi:two-component system chemotaxis response regulator CheB